MSTDKIALYGLIAGVVGGVAGLVGAVAAIFAAIYAKGSATQEGLALVERNTASTTAQLGTVREHLAQVEQNTAAASSQLADVRSHVAQVESHLGVQNRREELEDFAKRVSIEVTADAWNDEPIVFSLAVAEPDIILKRINLVNRDGLLFGSCVCSEIGPGQYTASASPNKMAKWRDGGEMIPGGGERKSVTINAIMDYLGSRIDRTFPVVLVITWRQRPGCTTAYYSVSGQC